MGRLKMAFLRFETVKGYKASPKSTTMAFRMHLVKVGVGKTIDLEVQAILSLLDH